MQTNSNLARIQIIKKRYPSILYIYIYKKKGVENADKYEISASRGVHCQTSVVFLSFLSIICPSLALSLFF